MKLTLYYVTLKAGESWNYHGLMSSITFHLIQFTTTFRRILLSLKLHREYWLRYKQGVRQGASLTLDELSPSLTVSFG